MHRRIGKRGQSIALDYTLTLGIAFILMTGLLIAGSDYITTQQQEAQESQLRVIGQQVAADFGAADRLFQATDSTGQVSLNHRLPASIAHSTYTITVTASEEPSLRLQSTKSSVAVHLPLANETAIANSTVEGGPITVTSTTDGKLRLEAGEHDA